MVVKGVAFNKLFCVLYIILFCIYTCYNKHEEFRCITILIILFNSLKTILPLLKSMYFFKYHITLIQFVLCTPLILATLWLNNLILLLNCTSSLKLFWRMYLNENYKNMLVFSSKNKYDDSTFEKRSNVF